MPCLLSFEAMHMKITLASLRQRCRVAVSLGKPSVMVTERVGVFSKSGKAWVSLALLRTKMLRVTSSLGGCSSR